MEELVRHVVTADLLGKATLLAVVAGVTLLIQWVVVRALKKAFDAAGFPRASIFINIIRVLIWFFALLVVLQPVFGVRPTAFVATLGVTSVVISLGMQNTVSNIVAGIGLMVGRVIKPGDQIRVSSFQGVVEDVTWNSTRVRSNDGRVEIIPNSVLNSSALTRLNAWHATDCPISFSVDASVDLDACAEKVGQLALELLGTARDPAFQTEVYFSQVSGSTVTGTIHLHLTEDANFAVEQDKFVRALAGVTWPKRSASSQ